MKIFSKLIVILLVPISLPAAENILIRGYIRDSVSKNPLPYANISVSGTIRGAISNGDGEYSLKINETENILIVSYIGYKTDTITVDVDLASNSINLPIFLIPEPIQMREVVVKNGYNYAEELLTNAYKKVRRESDNFRYRQSFYRETISSDSLYLLVREMFYDLLASGNGISDWTVRQGREARMIAAREELIWGEPSFSFFTKQVKATQRRKRILGFIPSIKGPTVVMPVRSNPGKYYHCSVEGYRVQDGRNVSVISVKSKVKYDRPIMSGTIEIFEDDYQILKYELRSNHPDLNNVMPLPSSGPFSNLGLYSTDTEIKFLMVNRQVAENVWGLDRIEVVISNHVKSATVDGFDRFLHRRSVMLFYDFGDESGYSEMSRQDGMQDRFIIRDEIEYDPIFWISNSTIIEEIPIENDILQFFKTRESRGYLFPDGLPYQ